MDPAASIIVTTSCFSVWKDGKKTNGVAKLIPAIPESAPGQSEQPIRVFFFDDNINLHCGGATETAGICNLRDVYTGEYVDFSAGTNGFKSDYHYRHTIVHTSSQYRNVLVQANILDAVTYPDYFVELIDRYAKPGEKLVVFMDVNGTILWDDTVRGKDMPAMLWNTMFRFCEVRPKRNASGEYPTFIWGDKPAVVLEQTEDLRTLIHRISNRDNDWYQSFWARSSCESFVNALETIADIGIYREEATISAAQFFKDYDKNYEDIRCFPLKDGLAESWFKCHAKLADAGHRIIINSFGIDSHRVLTQLGLNRKDVLMLTFNYAMWSERDIKAWNSQFER